MHNVKLNESFNNSFKNTAVDVKYRWSPAGGITRE